MTDDKINKNVLTNSPVFGAGATVPSNPKQKNDVIPDNIGTPVDSQGYSNEDTELVDVLEIRVLYKKCLKCRTLVPWAKNIHPCSNDPECPARSISFIRGRDPRALIEKTASSFTKAIYTGNKDAFMDTLKRMVQQKDLRTHIFDSIVLSGVLLEKTNQKHKDDNVDF